MSSIDDFNARDKAQKSSVTPVPAGLTTPNATPEAQQIARDEYTERLLAKPTKDFTSGEREFLERQVIDFLRTMER